MNKLLLLLLSSLCSTYAALDCTLTPAVEIEEFVTLQHIKNEEEGTFTMKLTYSAGRAWVGIGINEEGKGGMAPAAAIIGRAYDDGSTDVSEYILSSEAKDASGVTRRNEQLLSDASFVQTETTSTLTFTQPLSRNRFEVTDDAMWIYAMGLDDNQWEGKHSFYGAFQMPLTSCLVVPDPPTAAPTVLPVVNTVEPESVASDSNTTVAETTVQETSVPDDIFEDPTESTETPVFDEEAAPATTSTGIQFADISKPNRKLWAAHGIILFIAWGICAPLGIGASILRKALDRAGMQKGTWYSLHYYLNISTVVLTMIGFFLAVAATAQDGDIHFDDTHQKAGLAIFILVLLQASWAYLRPALPKDNSSAPMSPNTHHDSDPEDNSADEIVTTSTGNVETVPSSPSRSVTKDQNADAVEPEGKSMIRLSWEWSHRLLGVVLLGLSWYNCQTGIELQMSNWPDETPDWTGVFWGITVSVSGLIFVLAYVIRV